MVSRKAGTMSGFFIYNQNPHHEVDIEIKGVETSMLQMNYWTDGVAHESSVFLKFDASDAYHSYAINWEPSLIEWLVDGEVVHTENGSRGTLPSAVGQAMVNLWCGDDTAASWLGRYRGGGTNVKFRNFRFTPHAG